MKRKFTKSSVLCAEGSSSVELAKNPNTSEVVLIRLADDKDWYVRMNVAKNPNTPPDVLARLADDEYLAVRLAVEHNPNTPIEVLTKFASKLEEAYDKCTEDDDDSIVDVHRLSESDEEFDMFDIEESYLSELENECLDELGLWLEPSIQGNQGGVWIYTQGDDDIVVDSYDYASYVEKCIDIALASDNEEEFKSRYTQFINSIID